MHPILALFALLTTLISALPTTPLLPVVTLALYTGAECKGLVRDLKLEPNKCYGLRGAQGLSVVRHDDGLKYNALRISHGESCDQGWELQPLQPACSNVGTYGSIKVVTGE